jgi:hypothetical protein
VVPLCPLRPCQHAGSSFVSMQLPEVHGPDAPAIQRAPLSAPKLSGTYLESAEKANSTFPAIAFV